MGFELEECYPDGAPEGFPVELFAAVPASDDMCVRDLALQQKIETLEAEMTEMGGVATGAELPVDHKFADGVYVRTLFIPKGATVIGKLHLRECVNIMVQGDIVLLTVDGPVRLLAPQMFVSAAGTKKVAYANEDTVWVTTHSLPVTPVEQIADLLTVPSFKHYAALKASELKELT